MKDIGDFLLEKYGPRMTTANLAEVLHKSADQVRNEISAETFPIPTYKESESQRSPRYADTRDVADYLNKVRPSVPPVSQGQGGYSASKIANRSARKSPPPRGPESLSQTTVR